jgi:Ca2+-binding RTX toxin-like protein
VTNGNDLEGIASIVKDILSAKTIGGKAIVGRPDPAGQRLGQSVQRGRGEQPHGGNGDDTLFVKDAATSGNLTIHLGSGNDTVIAGRGNDVVHVGSGNDTPTGGGGNNTYAFAAGGGETTITDFNTATDHIDLIAFTGIDTFADVRGAAIQDGADTLIEFGNAQSITLQNVPTVMPTFSGGALATGRP